MLLVLAVKTYVLGGCMTPIAFAVLGTGILFGCKKPRREWNLIQCYINGFRVNGNIRFYFFNCRLFNLFFIIFILIYVLYNNNF